MIAFGVHQRHPCTGCIPTCCEMLLKAANAQGIDFTNFQEEFDLDLNLQPPPKNDFGSVTKAITAKYPKVLFCSRSFPKGSGKDKLQFIEKHFSQTKPLMISLWEGVFGHPNWHIMIVIDMEPTKLILLHGINVHGQEDIRALDKTLLVSIHDSCDGGDNVAWLEHC